MGEEPAVDVARLMEEIKERVRQRKASGFYSEEEIRRITQMELEVREVLPGYRDELDFHLTTLNEIWDPKEPEPLTSHRRVIGPVIVALKRIVQRLGRPLIGLALARQARVNSHLVQLLNSFAPQIRDHLREVAHRLDQAQEEMTLAHTEEERRHRELFARVEALKAEVARLTGHLDALATTRHLSGDVPAAPQVPAGMGELTAEHHLAFEDLHRGSRAEIKERQRAHLSEFSEGPILDLGCGRGEFLELCREAGLEARGVDTNPRMVEACRALGLAAEKADALAHLQALPDASLGGVFCAHLIEHLEPRGLVALVQLVHAKLRPGGVFVAETPNPACLSVFSGAFYLDPTHQKPIHPLLARFLLEAAGFKETTVRFLSPYPPEMRLQPLESAWWMRRIESEYLDILNDNFAKLNDLLWGCQDYAAIGKKP